LHISNVAESMLLAKFNITPKFILPISEFKYMSEI